MTNCLFFGDSITYGEYDGVYGGWVDLLKRYCHAKYKEGSNEVNIFNLGIGGETTNGLLKRLDVELEARKSSTKTVVFISYGANDLAYINDKQNVRLNEFKENLQKAIVKAQAITSELHVLSILPIADAFDGIETFTGKTRRNDDIIAFNNIIKEVSHNHSISYIDTYPVFLDNKEELLSNDGIHPNEKGYALISNIVKPFIKIYL